LLIAVMNCMTGKIKKRIFIVGCPRSGTTLVQSMLLQAADVYSFPETHFFEVLRNSKKSRILLFLFHGIFVQHVYKEWLKTTDIPSYSNYIQPCFSIRKAMGLFTNHLDTAAQQNGSTIWIEKTPGHINHINFITKYIPDAHFIHVIRDGKAVVASLYEVTRQHPELWFGERSIDECITTWNSTIKRSLSQIKKANNHFVLYEDLCGTPQEALTKLCEETGLAYTENLITEFSKGINKIINNKEKWKKDNRQSHIQNRGTEKYKKLFTPAQQAYIYNELNCNAYLSLINSLRNQRQ